MEYFQAEVWVNCSRAGSGMASLLGVCWEGVGGIEGGIK